MKKSNTIYYLAGAVLLYIIYNKYYKNKVNTPVIKQTLESQKTTPLQQTTTSIADTLTKNNLDNISVKYAISGSRILGAPSII